MMPDFKPRNSNFYKIAFIVAWICLWFIPWQGLFPNPSNLYLVLLLDMFRLGIAMVGFILPGVFLYILVEQKPGNVVFRPGVLPIGFALSVAIIGVVGLVGRVSGWSFVTVKYIFALIGLGELILLTFCKPGLIVDKSKVALESLRSDLTTPSLVLAVMLASLMTLNGYLFFYDDTSYLAYITNWQFSDQLGFKNLVFDGNIIESSRFWLAMYPMGQALLSDLSGVPGLLLLSNYLELLLVPGAVITSYWFAQMLGLSRRGAGFAALIQVSFFSWMNWNAWPVGTWFFQSMAEDKVSAAFLLSPVFFVFVIRFIQSPGINSLLLVLLSGLSLTLTHPVILFFSCAIAIMMGVFSCISHQANWRVVLQFTMVIVILMLPYVIIRLAGGLSQSTITYDAENASETFQVERYIRAINGVFYGLNPELLKFLDISLDGSGHVAFQFFRLTPILLLVVAGIWSLVNLRKGVLYWYVLACLLLILFATLPYTGWLLGLIVSSRMISRAAWFSPLGLSGVLVLMLMMNWLKSLRGMDYLERIVIFKTLNVRTELIGLAICLMFVAPLLIVSLVLQTPLFFEELDHSRQLAQVGRYIDQSTTNRVTAIALDYDDTQLLPGVSSHVSLISFREEQEYNPHNYFFSIDEIHERLDASNTIRSLESSVLPDKRCQLLEKYDVRFVLAESNTAEQYKQLTSGCKKKPLSVLSTDNLVLLEYR